MQGLNLDQYPDLVEEAAKNCAKQIQEEIDWHIITDMLVGVGWTKIQFEPLRGVEEAYDISAWIKTNCQGKVQSRGETWIFEKAEDAEWFTLKWK